LDNYEYLYIFQLDKSIKKVLLEYYKIKYITSYIVLQCIYNNLYKKMKSNKIQIQMRKWILEYIVLIILSQSELYWWEIIKILKDNKVDIVEWTLYPLLNRLVKDKLVVYRWEESKYWPPRKYYNISKTGKKDLHIMEQTYQELDNAIKNLITKKNKDEK